MKDGTGRGRKAALPYIDVNRHGVLKVSGSLWAILLFQTRHWWFMLLVGVAFRRAPETAVLASGFSWPELALELPTLLVLLALANRQPEAGGWARRLWRQGRQLLTATAALHIAWAGLMLARATVWHPWPERGLAAMLIADLAIVAYLWRSPLPKQIFSEFPKPPVK